MTSILRMTMKLVLIIIVGVILFVTVGLLMLKHDLVSYKNYWEKRALNSAQPGSILYVALGDSAAQGIGASTPEKGYVGLLANRLEEESSQPVHVVNISVSGAKVADVTKNQIPKLKNLPINADTVVTLDIGANDMRNFEPIGFTKSMDELMRGLPPQTVLSDIPYFGGGILKASEPSAVTASAIIRELAQKYNLRMAELHQITTERDKLHGYAADFFHPNNTAYRNWYLAFAEKLFE